MTDTVFLIAPLPARGGFPSALTSVTKFLVSQNLRVKVLFIAGVYRRTKLNHSFPGYLQKLGADTTIVPAALSIVPGLNQLVAGFLMSARRRPPKAFVSFGPLRFSAYLARASRADVKILYYLEHGEGSSLYERLLNQTSDFDRVLVVSPATIEPLKRQLPSSQSHKVLWVPQGTEYYFDKANKTPKKNGYFRAVVMGRLEPEKGVLDLAEKWVQRCKQNWILSIYGDGSERRKLMELEQSQSASSKNVIYKGSFEAKDRGNSLSKIFQEADVLIMPTTRHAEGMPSTILESMCSGTPVVATNVGGSRALSKDFFSDLPNAIKVVNPDQMFAALEQIESLIDGTYDVSREIREFYDTYFSDDAIKTKLEAVFTPARRGV